VSERLTMYGDKLKA